MIELMEDRYSVNESNKKRRNNSHCRLKYVDVGVFYFIIFSNFSFFIDIAQDLSFRMPLQN